MVRFLSVDDVLLRIDHLVAIVPDRPGAEEMEDLGLHHPFVAQGLVSPDDERDLLRIASVLFEMLRRRPSAITTCSARGWR